VSYRLQHHTTCISVSICNNIYIQFWLILICVWSWYFFLCRCLYSICKNMYLYVYRIPIYHDQNVPVLASHINGLPRCPMTCPPGFSLSRRRMLSPHQRVVREWPRAWCETHLAQTELLQCLLYYCGAHLAHLRYLKNLVASGQTERLDLAESLSVKSVSVRSLIDSDLKCSLSQSSLHWILTKHPARRTSTSPASHQTWLHHPKFWKETIKPL